MSLLQNPFPQTHYLLENWLLDLAIISEGSIDPRIVSDSKFWHLKVENWALVCDPENEIWKKVVVGDQHGDLSRVIRLYGFTEKTIFLGLLNYCEVSKPQYDSIFASLRRWKTVFLEG